MNKTCVKCNRLFTSIYLLNKHLNKKISCDVILECIRCKKIFETDDKLSIHLNKKIPCLILDTKLSDKLVLLNLQDEQKRQNIELKLKNEKEKEEIKLQNEREKKELKLKNDQQKEDQKRQDVETRLKNEKELVDQKAEVKRELINLNIKLRQEMQDRRSADLRYLDDTKNKRKMMTAKMINDQVLLENQRAINDKREDDKEEYRLMYNKVMNEYIPINKYPFTQSSHLMIFTISQEHMEDSVDMFNRINSSEEYIIQVLEIVLQNKNLGYRNIFYNAKLDIYCVISTDTTGKPNVIYKKYDQILKILQPLLNFCYQICAGRGLMTPQYKFENVNNKEISDKFEKFKVEYDVYLKAIKYNDEMIAKQKELAIMPPPQKNATLQIEPKYEMDISMEMEIELDNNNIKVLLEMLEYNIKKNTSF